MNGPLFLHYNREELDAQYGNPGDPAKAETYISQWTIRSVKARSELNCNLNIAYGSSDSETLDIFFSGLSENCPINVFYHGGYWRAQDKDEFSYVAYGFYDSGTITVVVNYALVPKVTFDELVRQCRAALVWIWRNANRFGGNPKKLFVSGHSAGGHIVGMLMATDWPALDSKLPSQLISGGCAISGLYDLEPIRLCFLNKELRLSEKEAARNSPIKQKRTCHSPLLLAVGGNESTEFLRQTNSLAEAWHQSEDPPQVLVMPDEDHFTVADQLGDAKSKLSQKIQDQMSLESSQALSF